MKFSKVSILILCIISYSFIVLNSCKQETKSPESQLIEIDTMQGFSLLNKPLIKRQVDINRDSLQIANYNKAFKDYVLDNNAENIIWLGRRIAYLGDYKMAIEVFSEGIYKFPEDARMYRHRGHRYVSLRQLDKAIADLEKASQLIIGKQDEIEPDGIPNRLNTPISSLHTNIWYHLGLAYYLNNDQQNALKAFNECLLASNNDDMVVAASHWIYMIHRRMKNETEANEILDRITENMDIIENMSYHKLLLFYKGLFNEDKLIKNPDGSIGANEAVLYGLGNWYLYNNNIDKASEVFKGILDNGNWAAFGYLAAEADLNRM